MKKEAIIEFAGIVAVGMAFCVFLALITLRNDKRLMATSDCVNVKWEEYEDQTGKMPPQALEQAWYRECVEDIKNAK